MARVNLERRAAIGEAKRARTRAAILAAMRACYAASDTAYVTAEAVTKLQGWRKEPSTCTSRILRRWRPNWATRLSRN